jgi:hypothetical protein
MANIRSENLFYSLMIIHDFRQFVKTNVLFDRQRKGGLKEKVFSEIENKARLAGLSLTFQPSVQAIQGILPHLLRVALSVLVEK